MQHLACERARKNFWRSHQERRKSKISKEWKFQRYWVFEFSAFSRERRQFIRWLNVWNNDLCCSLRAESMFTVRVLYRFIASHKSAYTCVFNNLIGELSFEQSHLLHDPVIAISWIVEVKCAAEAPPYVHSHVLKSLKFLIMQHVKNKPK